MHGLSLFTTVFSGIFCEQHIYSSLSKCCSGEGCTSSHIALYIYNPTRSSKIFCMLGGAVAPAGPPLDPPLAGGAQYQVLNGSATTVPTTGLAMADPTGLYPYYQYAPAASAAAAYSMMHYPQMYQYAVVGAPPESSPTAVSGLHQFIGAAAFEPRTDSQAGGMTLDQLTAPALPAPAPQYQYRLVSPMPIATPDQKKPLA